MVSFGRSRSRRHAAARGRGPWNGLLALSSTRVEPRQSGRNRICRVGDHARQEDPFLRTLNSCVECHSENGTARRATLDFMRFQGTTFLYSRCFIANQDRFACTTCHDPHAALETNSTRYEGTAWAAMRPSQFRAGPGSRRPREACPVNASANCVHATCRKLKIPREIRGSRTITFAPTGATARHRTANGPAAGAHPG